MLCAASDWKFSIELPVRAIQIHSQSSLRLNQTRSHLVNVHPARGNVLAKRPPPLAKASKMEVPTTVPADQKGMWNGPQYLLEEVNTPAF